MRSIRFLLAFLLVTSASAQSDGAPPLHLVTTETDQIWLPTGRWTERSRILTASDEAGRWTEKVFQRMIGIDWHNERRTVTDSTADRRATTVETWKVESWVPQERHVAVLRTDGQPTDSQHDVWDREAAAWRSESRTVTDYDEAGRPLVATHERWDGERLAFESRSVHAYGDTTEVQTQVWADEMWHNEKRTRAFRRGEKTVTESDVWDPSAEQWTRASRQTETVNPAGQFVERIEDVWDRVRYVPSRRHRRSFASNGVLIEDVRGKWDPPSDHWHLIDTSSTSLDSDGRPAQTVIREFARVGVVGRGTRIAFGYDATGRVESRTYEDLRVANDVWVFSNRSLFTYAPNPVASEEVVSAFDLEVAIGPNPASSRTTVRVMSPTTSRLRVDVLDVRGRGVAQLWDGPASAESIELSLSTADLAAGTYVVRIEADRRVITQALTVVR